MTRKLYGWKGIAKHTGRAEVCLRRWAKLALQPLPVDRNRFGQVTADSDRVDAWFTNSGMEKRAEVITDGGKESNEPQTPSPHDVPSVH